MRNATSKQTHDEDDDDDEDDDSDHQTGVHGRTARLTATHCVTQTHISAVRFQLKLIHTATPDKTRLSRLPVDRQRRDADQTGSYA